MRRSISLGSAQRVAIALAMALAIVTGVASRAAAQDDQPSIQYLNPSLVAQDGDEVLIGTVPIPGYSVSGLVRVRGASDTFEVLRPHDILRSTSWFPTAWFRVAADGASVGIDGGKLWRLDATGPERRFASLYGAHQFNTHAVGQARGIVYFAPPAAAHGAELWRTDGTEDGTWMVRDIEPGSAPSSPGVGATLGSVVFFPATTTEHGRELWRTDGSAEGTVQVADLRPGPDSSDPVVIGRIGGRLVFATTAPDGGSTLWSTDGSRAGTREIVTSNDIFVEAHAHRSVRRLDDVLTFETAYRSGVGASIWRTDGTPEGTFRLISGAAPDTSVVSGGRLWVVASGLLDARGLWVSDGTSTGTRRARALPDSDPWTYIIDTVALRGGIAFRANTEDEGASLWFTNGATEETILLAGRSSGVGLEIGSPIPNTYYFGMLASTGQAAWFVAYGATRAPLWITDGTVDGTYPVDLTGITDEPESPAPSPLQPFADAGPMGPEPAPPDDPEVEPSEPLAVTKLRIDLRPAGDVDLRLRCRVPLAGERNVAGEAIAIDVGGILTDVVLDDRGRACTAGEYRVRTRVKRGRGDEPDTLRLDLRLRRAPVGAELLDEGLSVPPGEPHVDRPIDIEVRWREVRHTAEPTVRYRQHRKRGTAKLVE